MKLSNKRTVLLTSYMRPSLTQSAIIGINAWADLKKLIVVVDGLRSEATGKEKELRLKTIMLVEQLANSKTELWVYDTNIGITNHYLRLQDRIMAIDSATIWIEEDMEIDFSTYNKLSINYSQENEPILLSGYSHFNHFGNKDLDYKRNLFLPIWGLTMNANFSELIKKTWHDKKYSSKIVRDRIRNTWPSNKIRDRIYLSRVQNYWEKYMSWGLLSNRRWDALANYSLWTVGKTGFSSMNRLVNDTSYRDDRGMNQRGQPSEPETHLFEEVLSEDIPFCFQCEVKGSRVQKSLSRSALAATKYRLRI